MPGDFRLISPHVNWAAGGTPELVANWKPPLVVTTERDRVWNRVKEVSPRTTIVVRAREDDSLNPDFNQPFDIPYKARELALLAVRAVDGINCDLVQVTNEPAIGSLDAAKRLAEFDAEYLYHLSTHGRKGTVGNLSSGNFSELEWWDAYHPALEAALEYGGALALHQYNWPNIQTDDDIWYSFRHEQVYRRLPKRLRVALLLTEFGIDKGVRFPGVVQGFRSVMEEVAYAEQLRRADTRLQATPQLMGAAVFCVRNKSQWYDYDTWKEPAQHIAQQAHPLYRKWPAPQPALAEGIDVSWHQGRIRWVDVKNEVGFAFCRASYGSQDGSVYTDSTFERNQRRAEVYGVPRGAYHYLHPSADPVEQAAMFAGQCQRYPPDSFEKGSEQHLAAVVDVEENALADAQVRQFCSTFLDIAGHRPGIYTSWYKAGVIGLQPWVRNHFLWIADWRNVESPLLPTHWDDWAFWQYTSRGKVSGIGGRVDRDRQHPQVSWVDD